MAGYKRPQPFERSLSSLGKDENVRAGQTLPALKGNMYYLKNSKRIFNRYCDDLIGDTGLAYLWRVFEALKDVEEVVKPYGYGGFQEHHLIFPRLDGSFRTGRPEDAAELKECNFNI